MPRRIIVFSLFLILALASSLMMVNQGSIAYAMEPSKIAIYVGPNSVPADNSTYECIFVQLQDSTSRPARALQDTTISLSSSLTYVGTVESTITISKGSTFAIAKFKSTFTPGTTTIAATASGYATVQTTLVTVAPVPSRLAIYGFPPVLPSDGTPYESIVVQLQDASGSPAKAPLSGLSITLSSSNSTIASVASSATITGGQTYALATITSNAPGTATITAMASGYASTQAQIRTEVPSASQPTILQIYIAPPKTLADNTEHPQIVVQLLTASGKITKSPTPISVQLSSSDQNVGSVQPTLVVPTSKVYGIATFSATYRAGTTTITTVATDLQTDTETVTTIGPIPSRLVLYCNPQGLPADNKAYNAIQVQLQDDQGKPAKDPDGDVTVYLFSSDPTVGTVPTTLKIPYGQTYATTEFTSTYVTRSTIITAQASGYTTGQGTISTYIVDQASLNVTVTADPTSVLSGSQTSVTAYITYPGGIPATGATVQFTSSSGGSFGAITDQGNGYYKATFTVPTFNIKTNVTVTATVSKTDYMTSHADTQVTVVSTVNVGNMQFCIKDENGQPLADAIVSTLSQPPGMNALMDITNSTGYVTFPNAMEGSYTVSVSKLGYSPINQTIDFNINTSALTLVLTNSSGNTQGLDLTIILLVVATIIVVVIVVAAAYLQKRKTAKRFQVPKKWEPPAPPKPRSEARLHWRQTDES